MHYHIIAAFFAYFLILLTIGLVAHKRQSTDADFIIGNRSLNFWLTALSAHASDMSSWLFMAFPAAMFLQGMPQMWTALGLFVGMFLNWQYVAKRLRIETEKYNCYTLSTYFEKRYQDTSGVIRLITAVMIIFFLTSYLSAGLIAMGRLFETIFEVDYFIGLTVAVVVAMTYTFSGGFITVAWTDLFQAIFLLVMIVLVPVIAYTHLPQGLETITSQASLKNISLKFIPEPSLASIGTIIFLVFGWGLGYFGQPHIITKFMGIRDPNEIRKSKYLGLTWQAIALSAAAIVGLFGIGFFPEGLANPELVFIRMVQSLFIPFFGGIIICGLIAANMSTMDSQILVCASVLSEDFYKYLFKKHATPKDLLWASRIAVIIISITSLLLAFNRNSTILDVVFYAWAGLGCSFGPLILMSLYSKKTNRYGAVAGILVGGAISGTWGLINPYVSPIWIPAMIPGFALSLLSIYGVSKLTQEKQPQRP